MVDPEIVNLVSTVGFPIAICIWLLYTGKKTDQVIDNNTQALGEIKGIILNCDKK